MVSHPTSVILLAVISGLPVWAQDRPQVYENRPWGFRVTLPGPEWAAEDQDSTDGITVTITRRGDSGGAAGLTIQAQDAAGLDAVAARDAALNATDGRRGFTEARAIDSEIAGRPAPGIGAMYRRAEGEVYSVRQHYFVDGGILYIAASFARGKAPRAEDAAAAALLLGSFEIVPLSEAARRERKLRRLAARCDAEVRWAPAWKEAAPRARVERRLVLVLVWAYGGFEMSPLAAFGLFSDPAVVDLVNERFVPWRFRRGEDTPFESLEVYGMGPDTIGAAILLVTPEGKVVEQTCHLHPRVLDDFLRAGLARHPEASGPLPPPPADGDGDCMAQAERLLKRGELEAAEALIRDSSLDAPRVQASIHARRGEDEKALEVIGRARSEPRSSDDAALALDHAGILMALGRNVEAAAIVESPALSRASPDLEPMWLHLRAGIALAREGFAAAVTSWNRIVDGHESSRWAPFAAAALLSPELGRTPRAGRVMPDAPTLAALRKADPAPLRPAEAGAAAAGAAAWLRTSQAPDGSWSYGLEAAWGRVPESPLQEAVTAMAGAALLRRSEDPADAEAARRALSFVLRARERDPRTLPPKLYVDYSPWALAFTMEFFAAALDAGCGDPDRIRGAARSAIDDLRELRRPSGGWSYYLSRKPDPEAAPPAGSMTFTTAAVVLGLLRIRGTGVRVPEPMVRSALDLLERARDGQGAFEYQAASRAERDPVRAFDAGAAGRGPVIELALLRGGRGSPDRLRRALDRFREHAALLAGQRGKALMHTGAGGLGSHYLLFDYAFAAESTRELPGPDRAAFRDHLLPLVLACRVWRGGFQDTPVNGSAAGTALALRAFAALE